MADKLLRRKNYDKRVLHLMLHSYCKAHHNRHGASLCELCTELEDYCFARIDKCPQGLNKTTCERCPVHCYSPAYRERIREVMRYSGPRLLRTNPRLAVWHLLKNVRFM